MKTYTDGITTFSVAIDNYNGKYNVTVSDHNRWSKGDSITFWEKAYKSETAAKRAVHAYFVLYLGCKIVTAM